MNALPPASSPAQLSHHDPESRLPSNGNLIRLALLHPSHNTQDVPTITLEVYDLDAPIPAYHALSYTWNSAPSNNTNNTNNAINTTPSFTVFSTTTRTHLPVTANLYSALTHLRSPSTPRHLWIDQICIRQDDLAEKSHQIPLMGRIYREAPGGVIAWLGEYGALSGAGVNHDHLLQYMSFITHKDLWTQAKSYLPHPIPDSSPNPSPRLDFSTRADVMKGWRALIAFLTHTTWFTRVWIVQEASAQKSCLLFQISHVQFSFLDLCAVVEATNYDMRASDPTVSRNLQHPDGRTTYFRFLRACPAIDAVGPGPTGAQTHSVQGLVQTFCDWTASEPRDKVYAFLGLARGDDASRYPRPDYNLPVARVYRQYAEAVLAEGENILPDVLSALTFAVLGGEMEGQPSWVTNWASFQEGSKSAMWPPRNNYKFLAGGRMGWLDEYEFDAAGSILRLRGVRVERVARITSEYQESTRAMQGWLSEALRVLNDGSENMLTMADVAKLLVMDGESSLYQLTGHEPSWLARSSSGLIQAQALRHAGYSEYFLQDSSLCESPGEEDEELRLRDEDVPSASMPSRSDTRAKTEHEGRPELDDDLHDTRALVYRNIVSAFMTGRCLFVTETGRVGAADARIQINDEIAIFEGSRLPFVTRTSSDGLGCRLISEAFIRGIMHGEALSNIAEFDTISIV